MDKREELYLRLYNEAKEAGIDTTLLSDIDGTIIGVIIGEPEIMTYIEHSIEEDVIQVFEAALEDAMFEDELIDLADWEKDDDDKVH